MRIFLYISALLLALLAEHLVSAAAVQRKRPTVRFPETTPGLINMKDLAPAGPVVHIRQANPNETDCQVVILYDFLNRDDWDMGVPNGFYNKTEAVSEGRPVYKRNNGVGEEGLDSYLLKWEAPVWKVVKESDGTVIASVPQDVATADLLNGETWTVTINGVDKNFTDAKAACSSQCHVALVGPKVNIYLPGADGVTLIPHPVDYADLYEYYAIHLGRPAYQAVNKDHTFGQSFGLYFDPAIDQPTVYFQWYLTWSVSSFDQATQTNTKFDYGNSFATVIGDAVTPDLIDSSNGNDWYFYAYEQNKGVPQKNVTSMCKEKTCMIFEDSCPEPSVLKTGLLGEPASLFDVALAVAGKPTINDCCAITCPATYTCQSNNLVPRENLASVQCKGMVCNDEDCCIVAPCSLTKTIDCPVLKRQIPSPELSSCLTPDTCLEDCCITRADDQIVRYTLSKTLGLAEMEKCPFTGITFADASPDLFIMELAMPNLPSPGQLNGTFVMVDSKGAGVTQLSVAIVNQEIAKDVKLALPPLAEGMTYPTHIIRAHRCPPEAPSMDNLPFNMFICADTISGDFTMNTLEEGSDALTDIETLGGKTLFVGPQGGLRETGCTMWYQVTVPYTPIYLIGVGAAGKIDCDATWRPTSDCTATCAGGIQTAEYNIKTSNFGSGIPCEAPEGTTRTQICNPQPCTCNNGVLDADEECDPPNGQCCNELCKIATNTSVCRAAAGPCDIAEMCDGTSVECPADEKQGRIKCQSPAGPCAFPSYCDGVNDECPTEGFRHSHHICRSSDDECDIPDRCTGSSYDCPEKWKADGTLCGGPQGEHRCLRGVCDVRLIHNVPKRIDWIAYEGAQFSKSTPGAAPHNGEVGTHPHFHRHP